MTFRQTGHTTQLMRRAPQGATYVWPRRVSLRYATDLARHLGREDLRIVTVSWVTWNNLEGHRTPVVVDHAAYGLLSFEQSEALKVHAALIDANVNNN